MDDITAKRIERGEDPLVAILRQLRSAIKSERKRHDEKQDELADEADRLRTALNNLIGAIVNKKIAGLDEDLEEAREALEAKG